MLLRRLAPSVPAGAAGSVTPVSAPSVSAAASQSSTGEPPFTSGTLPWILDSGASFHMTSDCTSLPFVLFLLLSLFRPPTAHLSLFLDMAFFCHPLFTFLLFHMSLI